MRKFARKLRNHLKHNINCGDGRTRTAVQTSHPRAFYTFIPSLIVGTGLLKDKPSGTYLLKLGVP